MRLGVKPRLNEWIDHLASLFGTCLAAFGVFNLRCDRAELGHNARCFAQLCVAVACLHEVEELLCYRLLAAEAITQLRQEMGGLGAGDRCGMDLLKAHWYGRVLKEEGGDHLSVLSARARRG